MKNTTYTREQFQFFLAIQTRWADNDMYGHVNNVMYYSYFDTAVNQLLIQHAGFDPQRSPSIGLVVNSSCQFLQSLSYPEIIDVGVAITKIGTSSLHYRLAIFQAEQLQASAVGEFVHVFVDRETRKSMPISAQMRHALTQFLV